MKQIRFQDQAIQLSIFKDKIDVRCPKCRKHATVSELSNSGLNKHQLTCIHCGFVKYNEGNNWFGPMDAVIYVRCPKCRNYVFEQKPVVKAIYKSHITCTYCNYKMFEKVELIPRFNNKPIDPYFGTSLWLKTSVGNQILWAYNFKHLEFLKQYISAKLRERDPNHNSSLASRLPRWIKDKKNRKNILKAIQTLKLKFAE